MAKTCLGLDCVVTIPHADEPDEKLFCQIQFYSNGPNGPLVVVADNMTGEMLVVAPQLIKVTDKRFLRDKEIVNRN